MWGGVGTLTAFEMAAAQERGPNSNLNSNPSLALETEVTALREQSLTHVKERVALKAILDDKVRALISDIGVSLSELPFEVRLPIFIPPLPSQGCYCILK